MDNYKKTIIISVVTSSIVVCLGFLLHYLYFERFVYLDFEYVTTIDVSKKSVEEEPSFPWMSIIDERYYPLYNKDFLVNLYGKDILKYEDFSDTDKYSYIVTFGRKLCSIAYKPCEARTKYFGLIPRQYRGKVTLGDEVDYELIYVYRIKKINLVHDEYGTDYYL